VEAYALAIQRKNQVETELRAENAGLRTLIAEIGNELDTLMGQIQAGKYPCRTLFRLGFGFNCDQRALVQKRLPAGV
jgi:hypothetical protein